MAWIFPDAGEINSVFAPERFSRFNEFGFFDSIGG